MSDTLDPTEAENLRRAAIDRSVKGPVLFLFTNAAFWLMASTLLGFLAAMKLVSPDLLSFSWLTYGRVQPAHLNALVYGWGVQAALGATLWLIARRTANELKGGQGTLITLGVLWNIAVTIGVVGILSGNGTGIEWLEFPAGVWPLMALVFVVYAFKILRMVAKPVRQVGFQISTMYLAGALLWFTWLFLTANYLLHHRELGALGAGISSWYVHGTILLFFVPVGVGSAYYFIPKITGQPIHSGQLAEKGFWALAAIAGWTGMQRYLAGPLPAWMTGVGSVTGVLLLMTVITVGLNHHLTTLGSHKQVATSPTLRFTYFGSLFYPVSGVVLALISAFSTGANLQFTHAWYGYQITAVYGFFSMAIFGAIYYIVPRLAGCEWLSVRLIRNHFWFSVYGIATVAVTSLVGGAAQGDALNGAQQWDKSFWFVVANSNVYVTARAIAWLFILWSNTWFLLHLILMVLGLGRRSSAPTLLESHDEEDDHTEVAAAPAHAAQA
jgi:cytochrome c oxidase cbb3-type subunit I